MLNIFITYSWDNPEHIKWVNKFADDLESYEDLHIILDQYDLGICDDKNYFMEKSIYDSDLILVICTPIYAKKADDRKAGAGIETYMTTAKHWNDSSEGASSNIIAILKGDKYSSIPRYLKGKFYVNFSDHTKYNENISFLLQNIKKHISQESIRPIKTKKLNSRSTKNFQFDRVDDILAINFKRREQIDRVTDYKANNRIKYEYWKISTFEENTYILVLFNNINIKDTIERFIDRHEKRVPAKLVILRTSQGEKDYIKKIFNSNIKITEYTIGTYLWKQCLDQEWKKENKVIEEEFFIDQRVYKENEEIPSDISLSLKYINQNFINIPTDESVLFLCGSGGMGKSTLTQVLTNKINESSEKSGDDKNKKIALLIQSETIRKNITKDSIRNFEIKNLYQLYDIYAKIIAKNNSLLNQKEFELGVLTGKIIIIIDGLDEIVTLFHINFNLKEFISSLNDLHKQLGKTKIIITSRINILESNNYLKNNPDVSIIYLKGFEEDIWKQYLLKRFKDYSSPRIYHKKVEKYLTSLMGITGEKERVILPFFLDLISGIVEDEIAEENQTFLIDTKEDEYSSNNESIDYLIYSILQREIKRQKFEVGISKFIGFFKELAAEYGDKICYNEMENLIVQHFETDETEVLFEKIKLNPLFKINSANKYIYYKYDFLNNYFIVLYLIEHFSKEKHPVLDSNLIKLISKLYDGKSIIFTELAKFFINKKELALNSIKQIIKLISIQIDKDGKEGKGILLRRSISSLLYFSQYIYGEGNGLSKSDRMDIIKRIYNNTEIKHIYIWGDFYELDFSNTKIWFSEFHEFNSFSKSKFGNVIFYHTIFDNVKIENTCDIRKENFDEDDTCILGEIDIYVKEVDKKNNMKIKTIEEELSKFCNNFFNGLNFDSKLEENITISTRLSSIKRKPLDFFIRDGFIIREEKLQKKYYKINQDYHQSIKKFSENNHIDRKLKNLIQRIIV